MYAVPTHLRGRAFTVADAELAGLTRRSLQSSRFAMIRSGVYRTADTAPTFRLRVEAALLVLPTGSVASHTTALRLRGLELGPALPLHFSISTWIEIERAGIVLHRRQARLNPVEVDGIASLGPRRTFVDVATILSERDLVAAGDWLV
ncbi:MAG: hypothetical protein ABWX71_01315, partial [Aeromicrobium sp.]